MAISITALATKRNEEDKLIDKVKTITINDEEYDIVRLPEDLMIDLLDRHKNVFNDPENASKSQSNIAECEIIYEGLRLDEGLSLKSKEVQKAFGISDKDPNKIYKIVKRIFPDLSDRSDVTTEIINFSELTSNKKLIEDKKK